MLAALIVAAAITQAEPSLKWQTLPGSSWEFTLTQAFLDPSSGEIEQKLTFTGVATYEYKSPQEQFVSTDWKLKEHLLDGEKLDLPKDDKPFTVKERIDQNGRRYGLPQGMSLADFRLVRYFWFQPPLEQVRIGQKWMAETPGDEDHAFQGAKWSFKWSKNLPSDQALLDVNVQEIGTQPHFALTGSFQVSAKTGLLMKAVLNSESVFMPGGKEPYAFTSTYEVTKVMLAGGVRPPRGGG